MCLRKSPPAEKFAQCSRAGHYQNGWQIHAALRCKWAVFRQLYRNPRGTESELPKRVFHLPGELPEEECGECARRWGAVGNKIQRPPNRLGESALCPYLLN